jgi:hypothetical protein
MASHTATSPTSERARSKVATPWGPAVVVEQAQLTQRAGEKRFASVLELLENERGERLVRISYSTDRTVRRGPVTLRARDLDRLRAALAKTPELRVTLGLGGDA